MTSLRRQREPRTLTVTEARAALDREAAAIRRLQKEVARNFWSIGRRLLQVGELGLHRSRGFLRIEEWAEKTLGLSRTTTFQYMRVAEAFGEDLAVTFGVEKLDRGLAYIARTPEDEQPSDVRALQVPVLVENGKTTSKPFAEVTVAELRRATKAIAVPRRRRRTAEEDGDEAGRVAGAQRALASAVGRAAAPAAEVTARHSGGRTLIDVRGVPLERAAAALRAVAKALG